MPQIEILSRISIPEEELSFVASRSGGPGGQNVNKVSTRVTLLFDVQNSPSLSEEQRETLLNRLKNRINREGILQIVSQQYRTQIANRRAALERFQEILEQALSNAPSRKPTRVPFSAKKRRLEEKNHRSRLKQLRSKNLPDY